MASHFTGPVLNKDKKRGTREWYSKLPLAYDPDYFVYTNDFLAAQDYAAADWDITTVEAGGGDATEAIAADEKGGALLITNDAGDNDSDSLQINQETFSLTAGKRCWYETRMKVSDATESDWFVGLCISDTTPLVATDRVGFQKDDGDANIDVLTEKNSTETNTAAVGTNVDDTYVKLGFYWDGITSVEFYIDRSKVATHTANVPDDENLTITMHVVNGEAVAKTMTTDYITVIQER